MTEELERNKATVTALTNSDVQPMQAQLKRLIAMLVTDTFSTIRAWGTGWKPSWSTSRRWRPNTRAKAVQAGAR